MCYVTYPGCYVTSNVNQRLLELAQNLGINLRTRLTRRLNVVMFVTGQLVKWSGGQVVKWTGGQVDTWPDGQMESQLIYCVDTTPAFPIDSVHLLSFHVTTVAH